MTLCTKMCTVTLFAFVGSAHAALTTGSPSTSPAPIAAPTDAPALECVNGFSKDLRDV